MVESAIVLPLTVFMILGLLQLGLLQQGRAMAKYGAYKAARAGALHSAKMKVMENAALAVLLPVIGYKVNGGEVYNRTRNSSDIKSAWNRMRNNEHSDGDGLKVVNIRICTPNKQILSASGSVDFDDLKAMNPAQSDLGAKDEPPPEPGADDPTPSQPTESWKALDKGKLSVQVTLNYRLVIPFANMVIWNIVRADQISDQLLLVTRMGSTKNGPVEGLRKKKGTANDTNDEDINKLGKSGKYFLPIRASFAMRMMSNLFPGKGGFEIPDKNNCIINFPKR